MAVRGSSKRLSVDHENHVADVYHGRRSASSGAADNDNGDVRAKYDLFECKLTGKPGKPSRSTLLKQFTKVAEEAFLEGRQPAVALRFFDPTNILADPQGWIDLVVRTLDDDAERTDALYAVEVS